MLIRICYSDVCFCSKSYIPINQKSACEAIECNFFSQAPQGSKSKHQLSVIISRYSGTAQTSVLMKDVF